MPKFSHLMSALAIAVVLGGVPGCAGNVSERPSPSSGTASKDAATSVTWTGGNAQVVAGAEACPGVANLSLNVKNDQVHGQIDIGDRTVPVKGDVQDEGVLRLESASDVKRTVLIDGGIDDETGRGQIRVTTYQPACSLRVDLARQEARRLE